MAEYINRNDLLRVINTNIAEAHKERCAQLLEAILNAPSVDVVEVVRCKDCDVTYNKWTGCPYLNGLIPPSDFYCAKGTSKERGADKQKITCLNCKHLMFSDMYGECNKQLRIVNPTDTCEYAEPKERGAG